MRQIRARIREKRGVDYTEDEIRELASVKLEKFLDPRACAPICSSSSASGASRPRRARNYRVRGHDALRVAPRAAACDPQAANPILKLFFNPNAADRGAAHPVAAQRHRTTQAEALYYELIHNLVLETTRLGIEVQNLKMRVESLSSRLDFDERRARALEGVVQYRAGRGGAAAAAGRRRTARQRAAAASTRPAAPDAAERRAAAPPSRTPASRSARRGRPGRGAERHAADGSGRRRRRRGRPARPGAGRRRRERRRVVKLAVVVQRYGADINGGAELHARYIAERLAAARRGRSAHDLRARLRHLEERAAGRREQVNGVAVRRFPVAPRAQPLDFGRRSRQSSSSTHSIADELAWLDERGADESGADRLPGAVGSRVRLLPLLQLPLLPRVARRARRAGARPILVPTAERDPAIGLAIFGPCSAACAAIMYNSHEERALIQARDRQPARARASSSASARRFPSAGRPGALPAEVRASTGRSRSTSAASTRTRAAASCSTTSSATRVMYPRGLDLVLVGKPVMPIPKHPRIRHLGFLPDEDKFDALAAADLLIMPSYFESLSMVALEAWALGKPVLANGRCDVLQGPVHPQQRRALLRELRGVRRGALRARVERAARTRGSAATAATTSARHYAWPVIERKYLDMFERLKRSRARRRSSRCPAGSRGAAANCRRPPTSWRAAVGRRDAGVDSEPMIAVRTAR